VGAALCAQPSHGRVGRAEIDAKRTGRGRGHEGVDRNRWSECMSLTHQSGLEDRAFCHHVP
jgi:hypothetical protein